jgi:hypothetical protein
MCLQIIASAMITASPAGALVHASTAPDALVSAANGITRDDSRTASSTNYVRDLRLKAPPPEPPKAPVEPPKPPPPHAPLSYRYAELLFGSTELDAFEPNDEATIAAQVSWPLTERFYVRGGYQHGSVDTSVTLGLTAADAQLTSDTVSLAGGLHHPVTEHVDVIGELLLAYQQLELDIDGGGAGTDSRFGYGARGGARWIFDRRMEFEVDLRWVDTDATESEVGFGLGGRFHATDFISLGLSYTGLESSDSIVGGIRFSW